ncbi:MAG TPA: TonB-dependent receptor [Cyclobacteriaceae bacterium]|nr:TonB-dependent receptor [Cyclobacteriaceae bacterium]
MTLRLYLVLLLISLATLAGAQNGTIGGKVTDAKTQEAIIGANVVIEGTTVGAATDIDGNFLIANVKPGIYSLVITFVTYKTHTIKDVTVESGKKTTVEATLAEDVAELEEIIVTAKKEIATDLNLLNSIRESKLVVSGISSEQITKLPDRDVAQIAQRVPGVTIVDNRFVVVRGVPERYNQVMINGAIAPSTEIDRRSFSFDMVPAGAIDQMLIYKSGTAELPGDFAGGVIQLVTKQPTYEPFTSFGLNFGYRTNTTFQDHLSSNGSETDALGFDNGFRALPDNFPATNALVASAKNSSVRERAGKSLTNNFDYNTRQAPVDMGFNFALSRNFKVGRVKFNNLTSLAYSNSYQYYQSEFLRYNEFTATTATKRFEYKDNFYANDVRVNLMHNWMIDLNDRNKIDFKNLFVQLGEHETTLRIGDDKIQNPNFDRTNYAYHYLSRSIYSGQLDGTHELGDGSMKLNWVLGLNYINRNEPDYRRFRTYRDKAFEGTEEPYTMQLPASANVFETGRFWSELKDIGYSNGLNFEKKFQGGDGKKVPLLKAGYYAEYKTRDFNARYINYQYPNTADFDQAIGQELSRLPLDQIFAPENIKRSDGFVIEEGTQPQDSYEGTNLLGAGYISGSMPFGKLDVSAGFRGEYNIQTISARTNAGPVDIENPIFAALPSLNAGYNLTDRSLVRAAYSRTVNRPEFRELAPFLYYQFEYEAAIVGSPNLKTAFIDNIDLRWEMYPNPGELISIGGFYKKFTDPIETYLSITTENPQLFYGNAPEATSWGIEFEFRKSLASLGVSKLLRNTSINLNTAYIQSNVDVGTAATNQIQNRPLQGQSPYIVNLGLYYNDTETGFSVNAAYNVFGPRIFSVGDKLFPSWWEMPRQSVDFQIAKVWNKRFETKLNIQNLLNATYRLYQDNNNDNEIKVDQEALIQRYQIGTQFSVGLAWKFQKAE